MVTNTTIYTRQIYCCLNTDSLNVEFRNGDEVILMDQNVRMIFDEDNQTFHRIPMGGGGGGGGVTIQPPFKVVSGSITVANNTQTIDIPLGDSGITKLVYLQALCDDYENFTKYDEYKRVLVRYYINNIKNTLNSGTITSGITEINASGNLENWGSFTTSISDNVLTVRTTQSGVYAKPEVPLNYIVIGV